MSIGYAKEFDFDSTEPVQGEQFKEDKHAETWKWILSNLLAIDIALFGFWVMGWWTHGGYHVLIRFLLKQVPALMNMLYTGM